MLALSRSLRAPLLVTWLLLLAGCGPGEPPEPRDGGTDADAAVCQGARCSWPACEAAGCLPHQRCTAGASGVACVSDECEPGYAFDQDAQACEPVASSTCGVGPNAISEACTALSRACLSDADGAYCGDCFAGREASGSACVASSMCTLLGCANQNRACPASGSSGCGACLEGFVMGSGGTCNPVDCSSCASLHRACNVIGGGVQCGACEPGFVLNANSECEPIVSCAELTCGEHRVCTMAPNGRCLDQCEPGWVFDAGACRAPRTCAQVTCQSGQICIPEQGNSDATCSTSCPAGSGWDYDANGGAGGCWTCAGGVTNAATCQGIPGAVLRLVTEGHANGANCFCETIEGYFPGTSNSPEPCDSDNDGWVREGAADAYNATGSRSNLRRNARCTLRTVERIEVVNEAGTTTTAETFASPLPLYETRSNDVDSAGTQLAAYGSYTTSSGALPLTARARNSFTKACVHQTGDYNQNSIWDVEESQTGSVVSTGDFSTLVRIYFNQYVKHAYFVELDDGFYLPNAGGSTLPGTYLIRERSRTTGNRDVPIEAAADETSAYWQTCDRAVDSLYSGVTVTSRVGGDFSALPASGMTHHSQFKCMVIETFPTNYVASYSAQATPWRGFWDNAGTSTGKPARVGWDVNASSSAVTVETVGVPNVCVLSSTTTYAEATAPELNPVFHDFTCVPTNLTSNPPPPAGDLAAHWVLVDYLNGTAPYAYRRGCINECIVHGPTACPGYATSQSQGFDCYEAESDDYGRLECGCRPNYLGTNCERACASGSHNERFLSGSGLEGQTHTGYWTCMQPTASHAVNLTSSAYEVRGALQTMMFSPQTLSGSTYTVRPVSDGTRGQP